MKVLQIQRVIPNLSNGFTLVFELAYFKFQNVNHRADNQNHVNPFSHPWHGELECNETLSRRRC